MKKIFPILFLLLCLPLCLQATSDSKAKKIFDKTVGIIKKSGDIGIKFEASVFKGEKQNGNMSGSLYVHQKAFQLVSEDVIALVQRHQQQNYVKANNEVNVSVPPFYEQQELNPYTFISIYRKGFEYDYGESTLRGKPCYCIHLRSVEMTQKIKEIYLGH